MAQLAQWNIAMDASETATGAASTMAEGRWLARENLQLMLFLNLLKLGEMFARQPAQLDRYMQQSLLENPAPEEEEEPLLPPPGP